MKAQGPPWEVPIVIVEVSNSFLKFVRQVNIAFCTCMVMSIPIVYCSGCGKREALKYWFLVIPEKAAPVTGTTLRTTGPAPADSPQ